MFDIKLPKTVEQALALDVKNGNIFWAYAIANEKKNVRVAFKILSDRMEAPIDHWFVLCHVMFDIKMEDFSYNAG